MLFLLGSPDVGPTISAKWFFILFDDSWHNLMCMFRTLPPVYGSRQSLYNILNVLD
jgi:hypothetical protein